jgi:hypothetical protein
MASGLMIPSGASAPLILPMKGINIGGPVSWDGAGSYGRPLQFGMLESLTFGNPAPSLNLSFPGFWRFRWTLQPGVRTVQVQCLQNNFAPYPSMILKANSAIGIPSDVTATAVSGGTWVTIGPISVTASAEGVVWVQLWNNLQLSNTPCYFDNIITT